MIDIEPGRFEEMVATALDSLPAELGRLMSNVAVTVEHDPGPPGLLGLYEGIPLTSRTTQYTGVLPDRITIYRLAICAICRTEDEVADEVRRTVIHEVAHHFGIDAGSASTAAARLEQEGKPGGGDEHGGYRIRRRLLTYPATPVRFVRPGGRG